MKSIIYKFLLWLIIILFLEFSFILIIYKSFLFEEIFNIFFHSIIISSFFSIITGLFNKKINKFISYILLFILGILFSIQIVFYNTFKVFFSMSSLGLSDQLTSFFKQTINVIFNNILYIILFLFPFIIILIFNKKINIDKNKSFSNIIYFIIIILCSLILGISIFNTKGNLNSSYDLYHNVNEISLNIRKLGVLEAYEIDIYRIFNKIDVKLDNIEINDEKEKIEEKIIEYGENILDIKFDKSTNNNQILKINDYIKNETGTKKNKYTGMFKDYNLIYITAESFSEIGVSRELTPTLYNLTHSGFIFDSFYTPNILSTIGGEFQSLTGLYPDVSILNKWRSGDNYFPYGLGTIYKNLGYKTYAYHNNYYGFQDRHKYLASQGFTNYIGCSNGLEKRINCKIWPESDVEMIDKTIDDYINDDKFMTYYMTVSGHFEYSFDDNYIAYKNKNYVKNLNLSESAKAYVATQIELDKALELLIKKLEEKNKLDNTLIVLQADHYPYELDINAINSLSDYERDEFIEVNHNALIIWNNKLDDIHISKPCISSDVLPTVYNLFGIDYDSRLLTGRDILSDSIGIAIFRNHSFVTEKGTYFANNNKFISKENEIIDDNYINNINTVVNNRLNMSKLIIENDYYRYLLK